MTAVVEMIFTGSTAVPADAVQSLTLGWVETLTQAAYDLIPTPDPQTLYVITP